MTIATFGRRLAAVALVVVLGCGGQPANKLSANAMPIAVNLKKAFASSNSSDVAGQVARARELYDAKAISKADLDLILSLEELTSLNRWNDARKLIDEILAASKA
jgi:hypothetical protein